MRGAALFVLGLAGGCVYFNAMYDADREYDAGMKALREQSEVSARINFDSVIAKTGRIVTNHPNSKYADDAAILKTRAELHVRKWESASETARTAAALSDDDGTAALAQGLGAVALRQLGQAYEADSLLSRALLADLDTDDRAYFLFERGLARQELGRTDEAAADLEEASGDLALSREGRLTLSIALRDIGEYARSAVLAAPLLSESQVNLASPLYLHVDSLTVLDPLAVDSVAGRMLEESELQATRVAALGYLRGRAAMQLGDTLLALARFEEVLSRASTGVAAAGAAYRTIELRLSRADAPDDITALADLFPVASRTSSNEMRRNAVRLGSAGQTFGSLVEAYEGRGVSAAEALLRAGEVAQVELQALAVARGMYLLYVREAPGSRWTAKAIVGALGTSGHVPDPGWVRDEGAATDDELRRTLVALPVDDPYRLILTDPEARTPVADSAYVLAEADLRRRLIEIRRLFDASAGDSIPAVADTVAVDEDEVQF